MAKTVLTRKQVKKLTFGNCLPVMAAFKAILPRLPKNFFVGNCPRNTGDGDSE